MITRKNIGQIFVLILMIIVLTTPTMAFFGKNKQEPITIGNPNWSGIRAKNAVVAHILENIGYKVNRKSVSDQIAHSAIAGGNLDIYMGSWMPSIKDTRDKLKGKIDLVATHMDEGLYTMAVPKYVWEAGVRNYEDLNKYADKFNRKLYVGPAGWMSTKTMERAVKNNIYNLKDWKVQTSTQAALMAQMKKAVKNKEWIVFVAWKPHWMNYILDIKYLKDPQNLWDSSKSWVDTLARKGFNEDHPQVYKFFKQFKVGAKTSNEWIYKIGQKDIKPDKVAKKWVAENIHIVEKWLEGVEASNGEPAIKVLKENI